MFASITLNVAQVLGLILVLLYYLDGIKLSSWMASLPIFLTLFGGLGLRLISGRGVMGLSLLLIFVESLIAVLPIGIFLIFLD